MRFRENVEWLAPTVPTFHDPKNIEKLVTDLEVMGTFPTLRLHSQHDTYSITRQTHGDTNKHTRYLP